MEITVDIYRFLIDFLNTLYFILIWKNVMKYKLNLKKKLDVKNWVNLNQSWLFNKMVSQLGLRIEGITFRSYGGYGVW